MNDQNRIKTSKFLSLVLRHEPERIGLVLDEAGWVGVDELLEACSRNGQQMDRQLLEEIVATSDKKRFAFSEDGTRIRANQGHSVEVELGYASRTPPATLYHGTAERFLASIRTQGLVKGARHHVHLSADEGTASKVGQRHGKLALLTIDSAAMHAGGHAFYLSENGVWLTDHVPVEFIYFPTSA